jgi:integrase
MTARSNRKRAKKTHCRGVKVIVRGKLYTIRATYTDPKTGKRRAIAREVKASCPEEAAAMLFELKQQALSQRSAKAMPTLGDFAESWFRSKVPELKRSTREKYANQLDKLGELAAFFVDKIEQRDVTARRDQLWKSKGGSPATVNTALRVWKTLGADLQQEYRLPVNPFARVKPIPNAQHDDIDRSKVLSADELRRLLQAVEEHQTQWYPLVLTLALTSSRFGAVTALKWSDIDFNAGAISFQRAHYRGTVSTPKTKGSRRVVPIAPPLAAVLQAHRRAQMASQAPGLAKAWVFPSKKGTLPSSGVLTKPLREACKLAGIRKPVSAHWFRHTLNALIRQASDRKVAMAISGHVTEHMSEHYDRATLNERAKALRNVSTLVFTKRPATDPEGSESP